MKNLLRIYAFKNITNKLEEIEQKKTYKLLSCSK